MKTTTTAPILSILAVVLLVGAALPTTAEQTNPHPAAARFAVLVPWLPESLPPVGEVLAYEEHQHFAYLAGRETKNGGSAIRLLLLRPDTLVVDLCPFDPEKHKIGKPAARADLQAKLSGDRAAKRVVCAYQAPGGQTKVGIKARGKRGKIAIRVGDRLFQLSLPTDPMKPARIAITSGDDKPVLADRRLPDGIMPLGEEGMRLLDRWDAAYRRDTKAPWDEGTPSIHLKKAVESGEVKPGRAVVLGCGTGTNALYLAAKGFDVTAIDIAPTALTLAEEKAKKAKLKVRWVLADVLAPPAGLKPFDFVFDRGCYHGVRRGDAKGYVKTAGRLTKPGSQILILAGNANEEKHYGPPRVKEGELRGDFTRDFDFVRLDTVRFSDLDPNAKGALAWSVLLRRKP